MATNAAAARAAPKRRVAGSGLKGATTLVVCGDGNFGLALSRNRGGIMSKPESGGNARQRGRATKPASYCGFGFGALSRRRGARGWGLGRWRLGGRRLGIGRLLGVGRRVRVLLLVGTEARLPRRHRMRWARLYLARLRIPLVRLSAAGGRLGRLRALIRRRRA